MLLQSSRCWIKQEIFQFRCLACSISSQLHNCAYKTLLAGWLCPCSFTPATWRKVRSRQPKQREAPWLLSVYSSCPTRCEKPRIPYNTTRGLLSPGSSCSQGWRECVCRNHIPQSLSLIYSIKQGLGTHQSVFRISLNLQTDLEISTRSPSKWQIGEVRQDPELFPLPWKRWGTARLAGSQSM